MKMAIQQHSTVATKFMKQFLTYATLTTILCPIASAMDPPPSEVKSIESVRHPADFFLGKDLWFKEIIPWLFSNPNLIQSMQDLKSLTQVSKLLRSYTCDFLNKLNPKTDPFICVNGELKEETLMMLQEEFLISHTPNDLMTRMLPVYHELRGDKKPLMSMVEWIWTNSAAILKNGTPQQQEIADKKMNEFIEWKRQCADTKGGKEKCAIQ